MRDLLELLPNVWMLLLVITTFVAEQTRETCLKQGSCAGRYNTMGKQQSIFSSNFVVVDRH